MKKAIVITTINPPRDEIYSFSKIPEWQLICIGDKKSPKEWHTKNVVYLNSTDQQKEFSNFSKVIPWNIYGRKNIGYLYAVKNKARIIGETDDDVFPYKNYPPTLVKKKRIIVLSGPKFINIYRYFDKNKSNSWPRGFPIDFIKDTTQVEEKIKTVYSPMQNSVIDQDSDFDAIYRLISNKPVKFKNKSEYAISQDSYCPVNSQNTFFFPEIYPLLYIPFFVNPRIEDIMRGYVAQRILREINAHLVFLPTTTYTSNRNKHDFMKDFKLELPLYLDIKRLVETLDSLSLSSDISKSLIIIYAKLSKEGFVGVEEMRTVKAWIREIEKYL